MSGHQPGVDSGGKSRSRGGVCGWTTAGGDFFLNEISLRGGASGLRRVIGKGVSGLGKFFFLGLCSWLEGVYVCECFCFSFVLFIFVPEEEGGRANSHTNAR